jgi:transposase-like protein
VEELFSGRHFDREIIILCVRWYLRYKLSLRDLVEMMAERGLQLAHTTIMRWVQRYVPEFEKRWARYMRQSGRSWRVDETYLKVRGRWVYLYRAVDREGNTVDFRLSPKRDVAAAKAFFRKALRTQERALTSITLDGYAASHRAVREMPNESKAWKHTKLRSSKYLNNLIEQDHRGIKFRTRPMLGFKNYDCAATTIAGIELLRHIGKNQFSFHRLRVEDQAAPEIGMQCSLHKPRIAQWFTRAPHCVFAPEPRFVLISICLVSQDGTPYPRRTSSPTPHLKPQECGRPRSSHHFPKLGVYALYPSTTLRCTMYRVLAEPSHIDLRFSFWGAAFRSSLAPSMLSSSINQI